MFTVFTRSATGVGNHPTLREAFQAATKDAAIWRISFSAGSGEHIVLTRRPEGWSASILSVPTVEASTT